MTLYLKLPQTTLQCTGLGWVGLIEVKGVRSESVLLLVRSVEENPAIRMPFEEISHQHYHSNNGCKTEQIKKAKGK